MKTIVIIGNAHMESDCSKLVDTACFVIRFNEVNNYNQNTGTKIDALCLTNLSDPGRRFAKNQTVKKFPFINQVNEIWFPRPNGFLPRQFWIKPFKKYTFRRANYREHIVVRNDLKDKKVICFSKELYSDTCNKLSILDSSDDFFPSTGFLALMYVIQRFKLSGVKIILLGFSFSGTDCHPWSKEEEEILELERQKIVSCVR